MSVFTENLNVQGSQPTFVVPRVDTRTQQSMGTEKTNKPLPALYGDSLRTQAVDVRG